MSTLTNEESILTDPVDSFCYELAMALRRILGLPAPWADFEEEEETDDDSMESTTNTQ